MPHDDTDRFVLLATLGDIASARVFAARLEAEGIEVRLHGEAMGPYPVTVGHMAATQLWVLSSRLDEARRVMLEAEVDATLGGDPDEAEPGPLVGWQLVALALLIAIVAIVARVL